MSYNKYRGTLPYIENNYNANYNANNEVYWEENGNRKKD